MFIDGQLINMPVASAATATFDSGGSGSFDSYGSTHGHSTGKIASQTKGTNKSSSQSSGESKHKATTIGSGSSKSGNLGLNVGVSMKTTPLAKYRTEIVHSGEPLLSIPYQDGIHEALLTTLPDRIALCRVRCDNGDITVPFRTNDCLPPYVDRAEASAKVRTFQLRLMEVKPYIVKNPKLPQAEQAQRLNDLLASLSDGKLLTQNDLDEQTRLFP
jgi:hypothetical protein